MAHVQTVGSAIDAATTQVTPALTTVAIGDVVVVLGISADGGSSLGTPTASGGGFTFTLRQSKAVTGDTGTFLWTGAATVAASSVTFSSVRTGFDATRLMAQQHSGVSSIGAVLGGTSTAPLSLTTPSGSLTTTVANSDVVTAAGDWNIVDPGATRTYQTVNGTVGVERSYARDPVQMTTYAGHHVNAGATGAKTVGLTLPNSGGRFTVTAVELVMSTADTTPPTAPTALVASGVTATSADLSWGASTDIVGVTGYTVTSITI